MPTVKYGRKTAMAVRQGSTGAVLNSYVRFDLSADLNSGGLWQASSMYVKN